MSLAGVSGARPLALVTAPWQVWGSGGRAWPRGASAETCVPAAGISILTSSLYSGASRAVRTTQKTPVSGAAMLVHPSLSAQEETFATSFYRCGSRTNQKNLDRPLIYDWLAVTGQVAITGVKGGS